MLNHAISHGFKSGAAEQNYAGGDGASNADPGIFEILCFFCSSEVRQELCTCGRICGDYPSKKLKSRMN